MRILQRLVSGRDLHWRTDRSLHVVSEADLRRDEDLGLALAGRPGLVVPVSLQVENEDTGQAN